MRGIAAILTSLAIAACGGGGGTSNAVPSSGTAVALITNMQGTVAVGTPIAGAAVSVLCNTGGTKTTTTQSDGSYSVDISGCTGPFVITASGTLGNTNDTLLSLRAAQSSSSNETVACGTGGLSFCLTTNITPLTHAMAGLVASTGNPYDLAQNFAAEKSGITASAVSDAGAAVNKALGGVATSAGASSPSSAGFILGNTFTADGTGWDRVLDNVKVEVGSGGVTLTNIAAAKVDDMAAIANGTPAPALPANSQVSFNKTNFKTALATPLAGAAEDNGMIDSARTVLNACFAAVSRGTFAAPGSACANLATPDYLNDGKSGSAEFDALLADAKMDGAKFNKPEVLRFFTSQRALVKLSAVRSDGVAVSFRTVAENSAATGNAWKLRGNQRPYFMAVNGVAERRIQLTRTGATPSSYTSGLNLYFDLKAGSANDTLAGTTTGVSYVLVNGPGLPAGGQILRPGPAGCDEAFVTAATLPPTALPVTQPCTSYVKLASKALDAAAADPNAGAFGSALDFAATAVSDATVLATMQPMAAYTFEVHQANGTVLTFVERLRARPPTLAELDSVRWNVLSDATQSALLPGTSASFGGGSFTLTWVTQVNTPPVGRVLLQMRTDAASAPVQGSQSVSLTANTTTIPNVTPGFPAVTNAAGGYQSIQLESRNRSDLQIISTWRY